MGMKKKAKTLAELYPVVEEDGGAVPTLPEPKPANKEPHRISRRGASDLRPVTLEALQNTELKSLMALQQLALALLTEKHPLGLKISQTCQTLWQMHYLRDEIVKYDEFKKRESAEKLRTGVTKERVENFKAAYIAKNNGKERGWKSAALLEFRIKDNRTLDRIME